MITIDFKLLSDEATLPKLAHEDDAGFDLCAAEDKVIDPLNSTQVDTFVAWEPSYSSDNFKIVGIVKARSGYSFNNSIEVGAGVIDQSYRGSIKVKMYNFGLYPFYIHKGQKITQLLPVLIPKINVRQVDQLSDTLRSTKGFGSTGE